MWSNTPDFTGTQDCNSIVACADGGFLINGRSAGNNANVTFIVKTDASGTVQWSREILMDFTDFETHKTIEVSGGFVFTGYAANDTDEDINLLVFKTNALGNLEWIKTLGNTVNDEQGLGLAVGADGTITVVGVAANHNTDKADGFMASVSATGQKIGIVYFGLEKDNGAVAIAKQGNGDNLIGGVIIDVNTETYQLFTTRTNANGEFIQ